jgi:hypothetical protein
MPTRLSGLAATAGTPPAGGGPEPEGGPAAEDDPFDVWLRRRLHQSYGATAAEPIPEELWRLTEGDDEA